MSATTLLILGCVRIFQPVHGYLIRRELLSWGVDSWGNVNPGSIYNGLRAGVRAGHLVESATEQGGGPARTTYQLTGDGEGAFGGLLRTTLWEPEPMDPAKLMAALCFAGMLSRSEMRAAMSGRLLRLEAIVAETSHKGAYLARERLAPSWTAEQFHLGDAALRAEIEWCRGFVERLDAGAYRLAGEGGHVPDDDGRWPAWPVWPAVPITNQG